MLKSFYKVNQERTPTLAIYDFSPINTQNFTQQMNDAIRKSETRHATHKRISEEEAELEWTIQKIEDTNNILEKRKVRRRDKDV